MAIPRISAYCYDVQAGTGANVTSWALDPRRASLLVHDMQEHFLGAFERTGAAQVDLAVRRIEQLVGASRRAAVPVVYTAQPPAQDPAERALLTDFWGPGLQDPQAARIHGSLAPQEGDAVLTKWRYSAFYRSDLLERMRAEGRDQLVITGIYAHIGCLTTALVAFMEGIQVFFVADAMADFTLEEHTMAARYVAGRCGQVVAAGTVLDALDEHVAAIRSVA